jgi:hypothetical protein
MTKRLGSPTAANEDMHAIAIFVMVRHPDGARTRWANPTTTFPHPMTAPDPAATNPNKSRTGGNCNRFHNRRRWRVSDYDFLTRRGRRRRLPINRLLANHTTAYQQ